MPRKYQHRVLFWGIFGALVLRAIFIFAGVALIEQFDWILFVFGAFLLFTAWKLVCAQDERGRPGHRPGAQARAARSCRRPPSTTARSLFTRVDGKRLATPLFAVLVLVEATDVVFAVDSVPAVLAVSHEQFIVFASNAFAILGLRALYFLLADMHARFAYLQQGLAVILAFVGVKMIIVALVPHPDVALAGCIALVLALSIVLVAADRPSVGPERRSRPCKSTDRPRWRSSTRTSSGSVVAISSTSCRQYVALRKVGRNWVGLCPFHAERSPRST